ncbi:hypothetical protein K490DRAFT_22080, partial [Saccharata proteae CBS 121410]
RSSTACARCRRMKTKCLHDGDGQPCRSCLKARHPCQFPTGKPSSRLSRPPTWFQQPSSARVATLAEQEPLVPLSTASADHASPTEPQVDLPAALVEECERTLGQNLWPWPCFHRPTFVQQLRDGTLDESLYFAMLASGARASPGFISRFGTPAAASEHFADKTQRAIFAKLDSPSLADVQALCLLALHHWGSGRGTRGFVYLAMASRMALMFLPQASSRETSFVLAETARRTIWTCFIMDQFLSSGKDRPPAFREEDLPFSLPCAEVDFHFGTNAVIPTLNGQLPPNTPPDAPVSEIGEFGHMIRCTVLWRRVVAWVLDSPSDEQDDRTYQQLETELLSWQRSLPSRQQDTPGKIDLHIPLGNGFAFAFTHCVYHCALLFLNRRQLHRIGRRIDSADAEHRNVQHTIDTMFLSAQRITTLVSTLESANTTNTPILYPIFILFSSFTAASTIAYLSIKQFTSSLDEAFQIVRENTAVLRQSQDTWPLAERWYAELSNMLQVLQD